MRKTFKNEKGITLIALVITIIVLLILAGVALSMVAGNEGILSKAETAVEQTNIAGAKEQAELMLAEISAEYYEKKFVDKTESGALVDYIKTSLASGKVTSNGDYTVTVDTSGNVTVTDETGNEVVTGSLDENGKVSWAESSGENSVPTIANAQVGDYVNLETNFLDKTIALEDGALPKTDWRVFYKDTANNKVYLIMSDYLSYTYETTVGSGLGNYSSSYPYNWCSTSKTDRNDLITRLQDTSVWTKLLAKKYTDKGITVVGAVDIETWQSAWNAQHEEKLFVEYTTDTTTYKAEGYLLGTTNPPIESFVGLLSGSNKDTLFFSRQNAFMSINGGYWLTSPAVSGQRYVLSAYGNGSIWGDYSNMYSLGVRPVAILSSALEAEQDEITEVWSIK